MKFFTMLLLGILYWQTSFGLAKTNERVLIVPFQIDDAQTAQWQGISFLLAFQNQMQTDPNLIPFTSLRKKLNEYGLSVVSKLSLASKLIVAEALDADLLVFGQIKQGFASIHCYDLANRELSAPLSFPFDPSEPNRLARPLAKRLGLTIQTFEKERLELFQVWASIYFSNAVEMSRNVMNKLIQHEHTGWLCLQEYLDLFGDPSSELSDPIELAYWRDLFMQKSHFNRALALSQKIQESRHNPNDFISHALVLYELGSKKDACSFVSKAEAFGFALDQTTARKLKCVLEDYGASLGSVR